MAFPKKISELPISGVLSNADILAVVTGGITSRTTVSNLIASISGSVDTNTFVTGTTLIGSNYTLERNDGIDIITDFNPIISGKVDTTLFDTYTADTQTEIDTKLDITTFDNYTANTRDDVVTGATLVGSTLELERNNGLSDVTVDLSSLTGDTGTNTFVSGVTLTNTILEIERNDGVDFSVDFNPIVSGKVDTTLFDNYSANTQTEINSKLDITTFDTYTAGTVDNNTFVTGGTLTGTNLILEKNNDVDVSPIDLSALSGSTFSWSNPIVKAGNTSGDCITNLWVTNIHSCSSLNINPGDEGNVYFGSSSGITLNVVQERIGIGTAGLTNYKLWVKEAGTHCQGKIESDAGYARWIIDSHSNNDAILQFNEANNQRWSMGVDGNTDNFLITSEDIVGGPSAYSADTALYIQRSNNFVGINTISPTTQLYVSGDTTITDVLYVSSISGASPVTIGSSIQSPTSTASGQYSFAYGDGNIASGITAHAEGSITKAFGDYSHAEGGNTFARGSYSHAEGEGTTADGDSSHAGGSSSVATGTTSFIHSTSSYVYGDRSAVLGGQNITGTTDDTVYVPNLNIGTVGGGTSLYNLGIDASGRVISGTTGGGAGTPGGANTDIQWNNGGVFSGSSNLTWVESATTLTINGDVTIDTSGNTTDPIFKILGSAGELFTVTDSLTGELFSVNDISGLPILQVMSDDTVLMGNVSAPSLNTTSIKNVNIGSTVLYDIPTSAYTSAYFDYNVVGNGSARAGNVMAIWSGSTVNYTETNTNDIGDTSPVTLSVAFSGDNTSFIADASTNNWVVKTIVRSI